MDDVTAEKKRTKVAHDGFVVVIPAGIFHFFPPSLLSSLDDDGSIFHLSLRLLCDKTPVLGAA